MICDAFKKEKTHIERLLKKYGLSIRQHAEWVWNETRWVSKACCNPVDKYVEIHEINSEEHYAIALHEIGHAAAKNGYIALSFFDHLLGHTDVARMELAANKFLLKTSRLPITENIANIIAIGMNSYKWHKNGSGKKLTKSELKWFDKFCSPESLMT